jgi:hypothetical protein
MALPMCHQPIAQMAMAKTVDWISEVLIIIIVLDINHFLARIRLTRFFLS